MGYVVTLTIAMIAALTYGVGAQEAAPTEPSLAMNKGGLFMGVQGTTDDSAKRVAVTLQVNGQTENVSGAADVVGFPFIENGAWSDIDWRVNGSQIAGTLKRKNGTVEGTFDGTITATGVSGTFTHVDGRVGLWSWDGPLPQR